MSRFPKKPRNQNTNEVHQSIKNLFDYIRDEKIIVDHLAANWITVYKNNENEGYLFLLSFLLESIGLEKNLININDLESSDMEQILNIELR